MNIALPFSVGGLIALVVLVVAVVLIVTGLHTWPIYLIAALAVARLIP
jgi:hypothetical protein